MAQQQSDTLKHSQVSSSQVEDEEENDSIMADEEEALSRIDLTLESGPEQALLDKCIRVQFLTTKQVRLAILWHCAMLL